ncbi:MAG: threonine-phosphate decarboxylase CobD [Pseudomonadota bacterium]
MVPPLTPRLHGGDPSGAMERYGGAWDDWLDLSTGINPVPYPVPPLSARAWTALPTAGAVAALEATAARAYGTTAPVVALAGAQAAIQLVPHLAEGREARVLGPTYEEHAGALADTGWQVREVHTVDALEGADLAVIVSPNNPDGAVHSPDALRALAETVGLLVVDESFADAAPHPTCTTGLEPHSGRLIVLRSFGKFYGLAGVRLGFLIDGAGLAPRVRQLAGPWNVSGPAVEIGQAALADTTWRTQTRARLVRDAARLDRCAHAAGWRRVGGTPLFRTYHVRDGWAVREALAAHRIWTRAFPYAPDWLRLGLPGSDADWARLDAALQHEASAV